MGDVERVMERVRRLLEIANDPAASDNEQRIALEQAQRLMVRSLRMLHRPEPFRGNRAKCAPSRQKRSRKGHGMSYRISLDGTDRTFQDIADAAEYARQLSLELNGSVVKVFDAETGLVIFTAKSRAKIED